MADRRRKPGPGPLMSRGVPSPHFCFASHLCLGVHNVYLFSCLPRMSFSFNSSYWNIPFDLKSKQSPKTLPVPEHKIRGCLHMSYTSYPIRDCLCVCVCVCSCNLPPLCSLITAFIIFADLLNSYNRQRLQRSLDKGSGKDKQGKKKLKPPQSAIRQWTIKFQCLS